VVALAACVLRCDGPLALDGRINVRRRVWTPCEFSAISESPTATSPEVASRQSLIYGKRQNMPDGVRVRRSSPDLTHLRHRCSDRFKLFPQPPGCRVILGIDVEGATTACGYGVPMMSVERSRRERIWSIGPRRRVPMELRDTRLNKIRWRRTVCRTFTGCDFGVGTAQCILGQFVARRTQSKREGPLRRKWRAVNG
jgi:hypothetical protein